MSNIVNLPRNIQGPHGICTECMNNIETKDNTARVYCDHNKSGAFMRLDNPEFWMIFTPISRYDFEGGIGIGEMRKQALVAIKH